MEGNAYRAAWRRAGKRYELWLVDHPKIASQGIEFSETADALAEKICARFGDGEAALEFSPLPPIEDKAKPEIDTRSYVLLGFKHWVEPACDLTGLYTEPPCSVCRTPGGVRNNKALVIESAPTVDIACLRNSATAIHVFSRSFVNTIETQTAVSLNCRRVDTKRKSREEYFEVLGPSEVRFSGIKTAEYLKLASRACRRCNYRTFIPTGKMIPSGVSFFVSKSEIPSTDAPLFLVGFYPLRVDLALRADFWNLIAGRRGTKGIVPEKLGVVDSRWAEDNPDLPRLPK